MYTVIDFNNTSDLLAINESDQNGRLSIFVYNMHSQEVIARIDNSFLPLHPRFSPDGKRLAFGSNDGRIYLLDICSTTPYTLFQDSTLQAGFPEWSSDGSRLVFSAFGSSRENPAPPQIFCADVNSHAVEQLTSDAAGDRFPQWDGQNRKIAFLRQYLDEPGMPGWVCILDLETKETKLLPRPNDLYYMPDRNCWSFDSSHILVTCKANDSCQLHVMRMADSEIVWSSKVNDLYGGAFYPDGNHILVVTSSDLELVSFASGQTIARLPLTNLSPLRRTLTGCELLFDDKGTMVYFLGEDSCVYRWEIGSECIPVMKASPETKPDYQHSVYNISARDGRNIPVHRFTPPNPKPTAVELVIGGPGEEVSHNDQNILGLVAAGFEVISPAYRGCSGYGDEHLDANIGEYGRADMRDVVDCGLDWNQRTGGNRPLALVGYSYGGYLSLLGISQPDAPWICGVILWSATVPYGVHAHRWYPSDPEEQKKAIFERSPMEQAHNINQPILILHGALDTFPVENLKIISDRAISHGIPAEMVVYEDDTHGLHRHYDEVIERTIEFIERASSIT